MIAPSLCGLLERNFTEYVGNTCQVKPFFR